MISPKTLVLITLVIASSYGEERAKIQCNDNSMCDDITWVSRKEWKARYPKETPEKLKTPVHHAFIHHTVQPTYCSNRTGCAAAVREVQNLHMDDRGWNDIGYSFLMGGDGRIYVGRGWCAVGAHTLGMNDKSVAISLIGNYEKMEPPKLMLDLAKKWIQCGVRKGVFAPDYQLHGHRDQTCTECPGQHLYDIIKHWKQFKGGKLPTYVSNSRL